MPPRISKASPQTFRASRVARNFSVGVKMRSNAAASWLPASARSSASAVRKLIASACSTGSMIFSIWRRPSGRSIMRQPNTTRFFATVVEEARQQEQADTPRAGAGALGTRQQHHDLGIGIRAEPFLAIEAPVIAL